MIKLNFSTNFTSFLKEENKIYHTIKVVTKSEVIECSGAVLCQHSEVLKELFTKENELFLDNYNFVQDCLLILHGDEVVVTMDNIQDLLKFSVQFGISEIYLQCVDSMHTHFSNKNIIKIYKICQSVSKFARVCGTQLPIDIFAHLVTYLKMIGPEAVMDLYKNEIEDGTAIDFLDFFTGPRPLITIFASFLSCVICNDNVDSIISLLSNNLVGVSRLSESSLRKLINKIDSTVCEQSSTNIYLKLKAELFSLYLKAELPIVIPQCLPEGTYNVLNAIVNDKLWKEMDSSQLFETKKMFESPYQHFVYSEILIAWITMKKPSQAVVTQLIENITPYKVGVDYMMMMNDKLKALGYEYAILPALLEGWKCPSHYFSDVAFQSNYGNGFIFRFTISCRNNCMKSSNFYAWFNIPANQSFKELAWGWYSNPTPSKDVTDDILRCPEDPAPETGKKKGPIKFFGATKNSVHLQFHTDWSDALSKWRDGGNVVKIGCVQFDDN